MVASDIKCMCNVFVSVLVEDSEFKLIMVICCGYAIKLKSSQLILNKYESHVFRF